MTRIFAVLVVFIVLLRSGVSAQQAGLSLADAVAGAMEREPSLRAARAELDVARGMRLQAGLRPNPMVSLERREEPAGTDNQTMVGFQWPLDLFRRSARVAAADRDIEATEQSVADRVRIAVSDIRLRYGQAAAAVRDLAVADDLAASARREFELLRRRVDEGASPPLERDILEVELRRLDAARFLAAGRVEAGMFELKRVLGLAADSPLTLRDTLESLAPAPIQDVSSPGGTAEVPALDAPLVRDRPDVREADARVRAADAQIDRARSEGRFDVNLFGSYMRMDAGFPQRGFNAEGGLQRVHGVSRHLSGGAMVTVPLRNRNQGEVAAAQAERVAAAARLEAAELAAQTEIASASSQDLQVRRALGTIEGSVRLARQNLDVMRQTYELGRATVTEVLAEQRRYLEVENTYTATLLASFEARTALQRARGDLP